MAARVFALALLLSISAAAAAGDENLPRIAVIPVFHDQTGNYDEAALLDAAEVVFSQSGRFVVVDASGHPDYRGEPSEQAARLRSMAADLTIDLFMLLDVSQPQTRVSHGSSDSLFVTRETELDVTGRFYTSEGALLGSVREKGFSGGLSGSTSIDLEAIAVRGVQEVALRSMEEIFPYEFTFQASAGPLYSIPVGELGGVRKGMIFSVVARSSGLPRSSMEYQALGSHGLMQITQASPSGSTGRLIAGRIVPGATLTAVENSAPAVIGINYSVLPTEVVPGEGLTGDEAETEKLVSQAEFTGSTAKWGLSLGGALFSGVIPRMSSIGIRGEFGSRIPLSSPSLALRVGVGFEAAFLTQNTRSDSVSSSANTATFAGTGSVGLEWCFTGRFGLQAGCTGRVGTSADSWSVTTWNGYNREALPGELYYSEIKAAPVSFSAGLTYMIY
ncbi:MAG TPA: hypothetical protein PKX02_11450 [Candidatus Sabulitectum sp.]|nr:hypothetical protein [Candidatus Sabulitectum sp.]